MTHEQHRDTAKEGGGGLSQAFCGVPAEPRLTGWLTRLIARVSPPRSQRLSHAPNRRKNRGNESGAAAGTFACYLMESDGFCDGVCRWRAKSTGLNTKTRRRRGNGLGRRLGSASVDLGPEFVAHEWRIMKSPFTTLETDPSNLEKQKLRPGAAVQAASTFKS